MSDICKCDKVHTGAGVIVIDTKNNHLILTRDFRKEYNDFGGGCEKDELCYETASRELYEESRCTIEVLPHIMKKNKYVQVHTKGGHIYTCFIHYTDNVSCNAFYEAKNKIKHLPKQYHETTKMSRFDINKIKASIKNGNVNKFQMTVGGHAVSLFERVMMIIDLAIKKNYL
jgi:ADP-ribose pyrophosphatase YjhB (NUDIX family)